MGHIYALCGCSGVGKTTFLNTLFTTNPNGLKLLVRTTGREMRPTEKEGIDYYYLPKRGFLQKIFANDFVHIEEYDNNYYGIEARFIEDTIRSDHDGIIMAGSGGATKLKAVYGANISVIYIHTGTRASLLDPRCLENDFDDNIELRWRLLKKIKEGVFTDTDIQHVQIEAFIENRMQNNYLDLAFINGRIRSGEQISVIENLHDRLDVAISQFTSIRTNQINYLPKPFTKTNLCFVLMPFKVELKPIYDDHLAKVLNDLGIQSLRADGIFSNKPIMDDILSSLKNARIVIADLTTGNPNVFYETGICMALGKEIILITQDNEVPFDLRHIRHIKYEYTPRGMTAFEEALKRTVQNILNS